VQIGGPRGCQLMTQRDQLRMQTKLQYRVHAASGFALQFR